MPDLKVKPQAKSFFKKWYTRLKILYIIALHLAVFYYMPQTSFTYTADNEGIIIELKAFDYEKAFVMLK